METTKNTYDKMITEMNLEKAQSVLESLSKDARWFSEPLTLNEFVSLKIAVADALKLLSADAE
jgi:hypothetical protein